MLFFMLLAIFCATYFGVMLPLCQRISRRVRGRRFVVRLGTPWSFSNPEHRWDVLMSFVSFIVALCVSMLILDAIFPLAEAAR